MFKGDAVKLAADALRALGAYEPIDPGYSSSWSFAGYKGDYDNKEWVSQVTRPRYQGPSMISDMINTPAADMGMSTSPFYLLLILKLIYCELVVIRLKLDSFTNYPY